MLEKYLKGEKTLTNCMASDAFFPFPDSIEPASRNGITCIIQPGGSINDKSVIKAADRLNISILPSEGFLVTKMGLIQLLKV